MLSTQWLRRDTPSTKHSQTPHKGSAFPFLCARHENLLKLEHLFPSLENGWGSRAGETWGGGSWRRRRNQHHENNSFLHFWLLQDAWGKPGWDCAEAQAGCAVTMPCRNPAVP